MDNFNYSSVMDIPGINARAVFQSVDSSRVFKETDDVSPIRVGGCSVMPWGADNQMPYNIISLIEADETLSTCQMFNAEVCYGGGLVYDTARCSAQVRSEVNRFMLANGRLASYFLGVCQDFKHFGFAVSVIVLNADGSRIVQILRKEACYCRFTEADADGHIRNIVYANFRDGRTDERGIEVITLLDPDSPFFHLREIIDSGSKQRKFAVVTRIPTPDSTYYPIPYYASLFRGRWYNIKRLIGIAKEAKLKNSAPIKYHIEINSKYWETIFKREGITDRAKRQERVVQEKQSILDFLTSVENSGKVWFSQIYQTPDGAEQHDVVINRVEQGDKEGGDWSTDIQEAVNMMCFTMRVHSNLVGSVPGKSQSNNSGSDKRELYTIAQSLQKPYHDLLFIPHFLIIAFNRWEGAFPDCPFIQLTTLDEHQDAKSVTLNPDGND